MNKLKWNFSQNTIIFIQEKALENIVCETAAILFWRDEQIYACNSLFTLYIMHDQNNADGFLCIKLA